MQSKKFRNQQFCIGDLVAPNWKPKEYLGCGVVLEVHENLWNERCISVFWQGTGMTKESPIDLVLLEQVVD
jgi:hypothetical protein